VPTDLPPPPDDLNALPPGTRFGELEILQLLGTGGFGLVYLAQDHALERRIAIKEYMPGQLAQRGHNSLVSVRSGSMRDTFELGLRSFVNEARMLARFDHRSLLKVYRFWEANNTAYMAMPFLQGQTLKQWRDSHQGPPDPHWLHRLLLPLLEALGELHAANVYHRDIAPDNIFLPADGSDPILLDFGAARRAIGDRTQSFTAILKPSYAPLEQYDGASALKQGPWTDLYALGAVLYHLINGSPPPAATRRALSDDYQPLAGRPLPGYPAPMLSAIDWALSLRPMDRPQSVGEFQEALLGLRDAPLLPLPSAAPAALGDAGAGVPATGGREVTVPAVMPYETTQRMRSAAVSAPSPVASTVALPDDVAARTGPVTVPMASPPPRRATATAASAASAPVPPVAQRLWLPVGLLAAIVLLVAFWFVLRSGRDVVTVDASLPASAPASSVAAAASEPAPALAAGESFVEPLPARGSPPPVAVPAATVRPASAPRTEARRETRPEPSPSQAAPAVRTETPAQATAPKPASTAPAKEAEAASEANGTADPKAACGSRMFIALMMCVDRKCREPAHAQHPECVRLREIREQRERDRAN